MCMKEMEGQPGCPGVITPMEEIERLLRSLRPELRPEALRLLREIEEGGPDDLSQMWP